MELFARQLAAVGVVTSLLALMSPSAEARNPHSSPPLPDLALSALTLSPSTAAAGATVVAKTTVTNQGTAASPATTVTYWVTQSVHVAQQPGRRRARERQRPEAPGRRRGAARRLAAHPGHGLGRSVLRAGHGRQRVARR